MHEVRVVSAVLLAIPLLLFGANHSSSSSPCRPRRVGGRRALAGDARRGLMGPIALGHVVAGVALLVSRLRAIVEARVEARA